MAKTMKRISVVSLLLTICGFILYSITDYRCLVPFIILMPEKKNRRKIVIVFTADSIFPFRFNNRPEVVLIEMKKAQ